MHAPHLADRISRSDREANDSIWAENRPTEHTVLDLDRGRHGREELPKGRISLIPGSRTTSGYGGSC
jgi:hypothetical protein